MRVPLLSDAGRSRGHIISSAADVVKELAFLKSAEQEVSWILGLNARSRIITSSCAALGTVDQVKIALRDVFRELIRHNCVSFIAAHNHPSGEPSPSPQDELLTYKLEQAGCLLGVTLLDHVIIAGDGHYSFAEEGFLGGVKSRGGA